MRSRASELPGLPWLRWKAATSQHAPTLPIPHLCSHAPSRACTSRTTHAMRCPRPGWLPPSCPAAMSATSTSAGVSSTPHTAGRGGHGQAGRQAGGVQASVTRPCSYQHARKEAAHNTAPLRVPSASPMQPHHPTSAAWRPPTRVRARLHRHRQLVVCCSTGPRVLPLDGPLRVGCHQLEVHRVGADVQQRQAAQHGDG